MTCLAMLLVVLLCPCISYAQEPPPAPMPGPGGAPGFWVPRELARDALGCLDAREPAARRLRLLEAQLELRGARVADLELDAAALRASLAESEARGAALEHELARPRRRPALILGIGFGVGVGVGALLLGLLAGGAG